MKSNLIWMVFATLLLAVLIFFGFVFDKEKNAAIKLENAQSQEISGIWIDYVFGGPPMTNEFKGIDFLTKKYGINYKRVEFGCEFSEKDVLQKKKNDSTNQIYFKNLEVKLGKNWKQKFDTEKKVLDSINQI